MQLSVSSVFATLLIASTSRPASIRNFDWTSAARNFEVVDGPKEFFVPVSPLGHLFGLNSEIQRSVNKKGKSDLDYMIYGKFYLMRMIADSNKREPVISEENVVNLRAAERSGFRHFSDLNSQATNNYEDSIAFPAQKRTKITRRPYRFQSGGKIDEQSPDGNLPQIEVTSKRIIEERSASSEGEPVPSVITSSKPNLRSKTLDEEDLELIELLEHNVSQSVVEDGNPRATAAKLSSNNEDALGSSFSTSNASDISEFGNRFLLDVPTKPKAAQTAECPDGQRKIHTGICKPVYAHNPSPQDGVRRRRLQSRNSEMVAPTSFAGHLEWGSVLKSFTELKKQLEQVVQGSEKKEAVSDKPSSEEGNSTPKIS